MVRQDGVGHPDDTEDVDIENGLRFADGALLGRADHAHAGVVDQDVDPAELFDHSFERGRRQTRRWKRRGRGTRLLRAV